MHKDLLVFIPSRGKPDVLKVAIESLYTTCTNTSNFDILCVIDNDQKDLYSSIMNMFPMVIWKISAGQGFNGAQLTHLNFLEKSDYYFSWYMVDDFFGLQDGWDSNILSKKKIFDDDFYSLYTVNPMGRNLNALSSQFRRAYHWFDGDKKPIVTDTPSLIYHYHEMMPVCTTKWWLKIREFFNLQGAPEVVYLNAAMIYILSRDHGYSRHLASDVFYEGLIDDGNTASQVYHQGNKRDKDYWEWARDQEFKIIEPIVKEIADEIFQHYRDIMDKPRGIGKFKNE